MNSIVKASLISLVLLLLFAVGVFLLFTDRKPTGEVGIVKDSPDKPASDGETKSEVEAVKKILPPLPDRVSITARVFDANSKKLLSKATLKVQKITEGDRPGETVFESPRGGGSGGTGEFVVSVLPGIYQVRAQCPSYSSKIEKVTVLKDVSLNLELDQGNSISGYVLTKENQPIGGAKVYPYPQIGDPHASQIERLINIVKIPKWEPMEPAVSGPDGFYVVTGLKREYYSVKAVAAGYTPEELENILPTKENVNFKLPRGGTLGGVVVDPSGSGVADAEVMAYTHVDSSDIFKIIEVRARPPFDTVKTGAGGEFQFETLGVGIFNFVVTAPRFQQGRFLKISVREGENPPRRFVISPGLNISGTVMSPSSEPIAGAKVRATRVGDAGRNQQMFISFDDGSIFTDVQGKFAFDTLEPGRYTLLAWHEQYATEQIRDVEAGASNIIITLPLGGVIEGLITEADTGTPITGARISVSDMQDLRKEGVSDESGYYRVTGLNASGQGRRYLNIHADGYARLSNIKVNVSDNDVTEQNFELERTAQVAGRVVNKANAGVASARVMAKRRSAKSAVPVTVGSSVTDAEGHFHIKDLEGGDDTILTVSTGEYLEWVGEPFSIQAGQSMEHPEIVLQLGGMVQGRVVGSTGAGISDIRVSPRGEGETNPNFAMSTTTDSQGNFMIRGLPSGTTTIVAESNQYIDNEVAGVVVEEGKITRDVQIVLETGGQILGRVVDSQGSPIANAEIVARDFSSDGMREKRVESDQDGNFVVGNLLSQENVEIEVDHPEFGFWSNQKVPVGSRDLQVLLSRLGGVRGVVVNPEGNTVPSFIVEPQPKGNASIRKKLKARNYTGTAGGNFEYTGIPAGIYDIQIRSSGYSVSTFPNVEVTDRVSDLGRVVLEEGGIISGSVVDPSGRPIPGATVRVIGGISRFNSPTGISGGSRRDRSSTETDSRGAFEFRNLKGGPVSLQVTSKDYMTQRIDKIDPNVSSESRNLRIVLELGCEIFGVVTDAAGNAQNGVSVFLTGDRPGTNDRRATNSEGRFHFQGLASGKYNVMAQQIGRIKDGATNPSVEVHLAPGDQQEVELIFE